MATMLSKAPTSNGDSAGNEEASPSHSRVWDAPTRLFHWGIVSLVMTSWFTAGRGFMKLHLWSGSFLLTLVIFRILWGLIGSTTARFSDFVAPPRMVIGYLRALMKGDKPLHAGHNPAGGWMVVALLAILGAQAAMGLFANDDIHFNGPLATLVSKETSDRLTDLHGTIFNCILLLVWGHVVAVGFHLFVKGEDLIGPMFTGKKGSAHVPPGMNLRFTHPWVGLLLWALSGGLVWWIVYS